MDLLKKILSWLQVKGMSVPGIVNNKVKSRVSLHVWTERQLRYQVEKVFCYLKTKESIMLWFPVILKEKIEQICSSELGR